MTMKLKKLEFTGFKSFYDKTEIDFHNDINCIVGPNGCGKSNVIDAIKWVMGEQNPRNLRAMSMDEIISNGGETLKPLSMAEVSIVISNNGKGYDEINVKRRLFRSGLSEYYINEVPCRLKDITELFVDTGVGARAYSIIGQGKVENIITSKPEGKREVIEEVAGIGKYKLRRKETQSRIESTKQNLAIIKESQSEILRQIKSLKKQADDAEKYKVIASEVELLENKILSKKITDLNENKKNIEKEGLILKDQLSNKSSILTSYNSENNSLHNNIRQIDNNIENTRNYLTEFTKELHLIENKIEMNTREELSITDNIEKWNVEKKNHSREIADIDKLVSSKKSEFITLTDRLTSKENEISRYKIKIDNFKNELAAKKLDYQKHREGLLDSLNEYGSLKSKVVGFEQEIRDLDSRIIRINKDRSSIYSDIATTRSELNIIQDKLRCVVKDRISLSVKKLKIEKEYNKLFINRSELESELKKNEEELGQSSSRLQALENIQNNYEWLPEEISKFILERKGSDIIGVLADFVSVSEKYEKALEAALGERLEWALVDNIQNAVNLIELLKNRTVGRATFYPIKQYISESHLTHEIGGSIIPLVNLITVQKIEKNLVENILKDVYLIDSFDNISIIEQRLRQGHSFVTIEGDYIDSNGFVSGGFFSDGVFERKREIQKLTVLSDNLEKEVNKFKTEINKSQIKLDNLHSNKNDISVYLRELEIKEVEFRKDIYNLKEVLNRNIQKQSIVKFELAGYIIEKDEKALLLRTLSHDISEVETKKSQLENNFKNLENILGNLELQDEFIKSELTENQVEVASIKERLKSINQDISYNLHRREELNVKLLFYQSEIETLNYSRSKLVRIIIDSKMKREEIKERVNKYSKSIEELQKDRTQVETKYLNLQDNKSNIEKEIEELKNKSVEIDLKLNSLELEIRHITETLKDSECDFSSEELDFEITIMEEKLSRLTSKLDKFGPVNLLAPEEYLKLEDRNKFLTEQIEDLEEAMISLKKAISKIDHESKQRFKETFDQVREKFTQLFPRIFKGGEGKLELTEPDDLLNTGVEVYVRPKGKKFQSINLLSGGEKALCAITLILSACFIKPAPFLLLDEIDAPLDDTNTQSFIDVIKDISHESQILLITHNKKTMLDVNYLIGITSQDPGTSKVVSVELH